MAAAGVLMIFGIKDVITSEDQKQLKSVKPTKCSQISEVLKSACLELRKNNGLTVAFLGLATSKANFICNGQFGTVLVTDVYLEKGLTKQDSRDVLSVINLVANLASIPLIAVFGIVSDRVPVRRVLLALSTLIIICQGMMQFDLWRHHSKDITWIFFVGHCGSESLTFTIFVILMVSLSKLSARRTRGLLFFAAGVVGALGVMAMQGLGGLLYHRSRAGPFLFAMGSFAAFWVANGISKNG